jgi:transposase
MSWDQYSQTPASNDLSGYFQTGMAPSKVKNAGWDIMADLAQFMSLPTSSGTANAQTVTNTRQFGALFTGMRQRFIPGNTNTGAVTLAVDGLTAKNIFAAGAAAIAGMLQSGVPADVVYDGTQWQLLNPQRGTGSFTATLATGLTTTPTGTLNYAVLADGKTAQLWCNSAITGTSNTTSMGVSGFPSIIQSANSHGTSVSILTDSGVNIAGSFRGTNTGTWTAQAGGSQSSAGFTNTGTKGIAAGFWTTLSLD